MSVVVLYDKQGCDPFYVASMKNALCDVIDDRSCCVKLYSECLDPFSSEVSLFIIPGGNAKKIEENPEFTLTKAKIKTLIERDGKSYLGVCAGAICASGSFSYSLYIGDDLETMKYEKYQPSLNLYPGPTCSVPTANDGICCCVEDITIEEKKEQNDSCKLVFHGGCYFPSDTVRRTSVLLSYASDFTKKPSDPTIRDIPSAAAISYSIGNSKIVLSGVHPEVDPDSVLRMPFTENQKIKNFIEEQKFAVAEQIFPYASERKKIMKLFLDTLEIPTKEF